MPTIKGTNKRNTLKGTAANETILGLAGDDRLYGNAGKDTLKGGKGKDKLYGGKGNDKLLGEAGNDTLKGDAGNDTLTGGAGSDKLTGGAGTDTAVFSGAWINYTITGSAAAATLLDTRAGSPDGTDTATGIETFRFSNGSFAAATILNDAPVANADSGFTTAEDTALVITAAQLLANDTDADTPLGDVRTLQSVQGATGGTVQITAGSIEFTPDANFNGTASFTYTIADAKGLTATGTVNITVTPVNDPTTAVDDNGATSEDTAFVVSRASLVSNDLDDDGPLTGANVLAVNNAVNGTVSMDGTNVTFTPTANFAGTASFEYVLFDGTMTDTAVVTVTVGAVNDVHTGSVTISGAASEDQTLTAVTSGLADIDGLGTFSYQWTRNGSDILGATNATYALGDADVGALIRVVVGYTDGQGFSESSTSAPTAAVTAINDPHTGAAAITGTATEDQTLTASTAGLADIDGLGAFSYQWTRNGADISGATNGTYTLGDADVGALIRVVVGYTDGQSFVESSTSAPTAAVAAVNDPHTGSVVITGVMTEDQTLTANTAALADIDGLGTFSYQWRRNGSDISGATNSTYTLGDADVGASIRVLVSYTDGQGFSEQDIAAADGTVSAVNDPHTGAAAITGTATEDQTLTAVTSGLADADGLGAFSYQWTRNGADIGGATNATYTLGDADVGSLIRVVVSYMDGQGFAESSTSAPTAAVTAVNDPHTGTAAITGTATEDQTLTASTTGLADIDGLGAFTYQWTRNGSDIGGATNATYTLGDADVGSLIRVVVSYTDGQGFLETSTSASTAAVAGVNDPHTGTVTVTGTTLQGQTLTAATAALADIDGLGTFSYQWQRNGADISGATAGTYVLTPADVGTNIRVVVSYTDGQGFAESETSAATAPISAINTAPVISNVSITETTITFTATDAEHTTLALAAPFAAAFGNPVITSGVPVVLNIAEQSSALSGTLQVTDGSLTGDVTNLYLGTSGTDFGSLSSSTVTAVLYGFGGDDNLSGGFADDVLYGGTGNDSMGGGDGNDTYFVDSTDDFVSDLGGELGDLVFSSATYTLANFNGIEILQLTGTANINGTGNSAANTLIGNSGANTLDGSNGGAFDFDTLEGGGGADTLIGSFAFGQFQDTASYVNSGAGVTIDFQAGIVTGGDATGDTLITIQNITGSSHDDVLRGLASGSIANTFTGGAGNDVLDGGYGNDTLFGGQGNDTLQGGLGDDTLDGGAGTDTATFAEYVSPFSQLVITLSAGGFGSMGDGNGDLDSLISIENIIGGAGDDLIVDNDGQANVIDGGAGNDTIEGGAGGDTLIGGSGTGDLARYMNSNAAVIVNLTTGTGSGGHAQGDTLSGFENLWGSSHNDVLTGDGNANNFLGRDGDDMLYGGGGNDVLVGGSGTNVLEGGAGEDTLDGTQTTTGDTVSYASSSAGVSVRVDASGNSVGLSTGGDAQGDTILGILDIIGSAHADTLQGWTVTTSSTANKFYGGAGNDILEGGGGPDLLDGGADTDTASYEHASAGEHAISGVSVNLTTGVHTGWDAAGDQLVSIENLTGSAFNDTLTGNSDANVLMGGDGNDILEGRGGADNLQGGNGANDRASYANSGSGVVVVLGVSASGGDAAGDTLSGIEGLIGSAHDDQLTGDGNSNTLAGGLGNDTLMGGLGSDTLDGGGGNDTAVYEGDAGGITVNLFTGTGTGGDAQGDSLIAIEHLTGGIFAETFIGSTFDNILTGNLGDDILEGREGADTLDGGGGNDTAQYSGSDAAVIVDLGTGILSGGHAQDDILISIENVTGSAHDDQLTGSSVVNVLKGGTGNDSLYGGAGNDTLEGGDNNDTLDGGANNDTLYGGIGNDILEGGAGDDILTGDGGIDRFVLHLGQGVDTISDFTASTDFLRFSSAEFAGITTLTLFGNLFFGTSTASGNGQAQFMFDSPNSTLYFDTDGFAGSETVIAVLTGYTGNLIPGFFDIVP